MFDLEITIENYVKFTKKAKSKTLIICGTLKLLIEQSGLLHLKDSIFFIGLLVIILKIR